MNKTDSAAALARLSLEGLSIGDAFGQQFFFPGTLETATLENPPAPPWKYTDDTEMAIAVVQTLERCGTIDQDVLAERFASRYAVAPDRAYGAGARELLGKIQQGADWRVESRGMFGGAGSHGNGAAMRVAPLGAWFASDTDLCIEQATLSAEVTHAHPEGITGAIAVALAAAWVVRRSESTSPESAEKMLPWVISHLDRSEVRKRLEWAATYDFDTWQFTVASQVGNGEQISAQDTVPLCLWLAASQLHDYQKAMWTTALLGGDMDTNCAIVGGIVALNVCEDGIPAIWKRSREPLAW